MRAVRFDGQRVSLTDSAPEPAPAPGEALVRPTRVLLSHDHAMRPAAPVTLGHQFVGVVMQASTAVGAPLGSEPRARALKGRRVVGSPIVPCRACDLCKGGLSHHCRARHVLGLTRDGALADLLAVPLTNLHAVPDTVDDERAALAGLVAAAAHASHLVRIEGKTFISVLGDGPRALLIAQVMARLNASVRVLGSRPALLDLCERWGVKHRPLAEVGRRHDQDVVVECTGAPGALDIAMSLARPRARVILCAGSPEARADLAHAVADELEILGCAAGSLEPAMDLLSKHQVQVEPLIGKRIKLDAAARLLAEGGPPDGPCVVVEM